MSVAPAPLVQPAPDPRKPDLVPPRPRPQTSRRGLWIGLILVALAAGGLVLLRKQKAASSPSATLSGSVRTATVTSTRVENTIRLTGVTAAANFVSLITPQLRGSRSGLLRDNSPGAAAGSQTAATASTGAAGNASTTTSSSAPAAGSAFQSATSRFGGTLRGSTATSSASSNSATPAQSPTMGANGLGTAADTLGPGPGGGGGGTDEFALVLQDVIAPGTHVKKGQVVGEFDRQYMLLRLIDYRTSVKQGEAALRKQKADLEVTLKAHDQLIASAKADLDKAKLDLKTIPVLSAIDAERAKLAAEQAEAKYKQLLAEVKYVQISQQADIRSAELQQLQAGIELKRAETNADRMVAKAPIEGLAVMQSIFRGGDFGQIQKGDQLWPGIFFMQIVNPTSMVINATVNQVDVDKLRVGYRARVRFDAYPGLEVPAHIESIAAVTKASGQRPTFVREVPVRLKIDQMDPRVIPDLSVSADVVFESEEAQTAAAPAAAVFSDGALGKTFVLVKQATGWERREVALGIRNHQVAAIKNGLQPGDVVALDRPGPTENP